MKKQRSKIIEVGITVAVVLVFVLFSPLIFIHFLVVQIHRLWVKVQVTITWPKKQYILFVYSQSQNWSPYIEEHILPGISDHACVIDRTRQQGWKTEFPLEKKVIECFASLNSNPIAIVFKPKYKVKVFLFFKPFHAHKQGKEKELSDITQELFDYSVL